MRNLDTKQVMSVIKIWRLMCTLPDNEETKRLITQLEYVVSNSYYKIGYVSYLSFDRKLQLIKAIIEDENIEN